jgi:tRNA-2-methylthio-N6-dimethylallyladenosine synthase
MSEVLQNKKAFIRTFGCQMNDHDSERMAGLLKGQGYALTINPDEADLILVNTCTIREKAEQKGYSELGRYARLKKTRPEMIIGMAGCVAQQEGRKVLKRYPWVDLVFGSANIPHLPAMINEKLSASLPIIMDKEPVGPPPSVPAVRSDRVRAWVNIMEGCNKNCTFCVVPTTRGRERSRPADAVVNEVRDLGLNGYKEVTLLGQTVNSFGKGTPVEFPDLLWLLNDLPGIERIRFTTSHPVDLTPKLMQAMNMLPKVCEHLHLPVQSGSDAILERMNRGYGMSEYIKKVNTLRRFLHNISLTTDIIVGFPGESNEDFEMTLKALQIIRFDAIFAFKYSPRPNTQAVSYPDPVPEDVKNTRLQKLMAVQKKISEEKTRDLVGTLQEVLVEATGKRDPGQMFGRTRYQRTVRFHGSPDWIGRLIPVRILKAYTTGLEGEAIH